MVPGKLSAIRRCPLFGVSAIRRVLKYGIYGKRSWYIAHCPLYGRCPLFGVSAKRGSTVYRSLKSQVVSFFSCAVGSADSGLHSLLESMVCSQLPITLLKGVVCYWTRIIYMCVHCIIP